VGDTERTREVARHLVVDARAARAAGRHRDAERRLQRALDLLADVAGAAEDREAVRSTYVALLVELGRDADAARLAAGR
jgi:hypothetical protein